MAEFHICFPNISSNLVIWSCKSLEFRLSVAFNKRRNVSIRPSSLTVPAIPSAFTQSLPSESPIPGVSISVKHSPSSFPSHLPTTKDVTDVTEVRLSPTPNFVPVWLLLSHSPGLLPSSLQRKINFSL